MVGWECLRSVRVGYKLCLGVMRDGMDLRFSPADLMPYLYLSDFEGSSGRTSPTEQFSRDGMTVHSLLGVNVVSWLCVREMRLR